MFNVANGEATSSFSFELDESAVGWQCEHLKEK